MNEVWVLAGWELAAQFGAAFECAENIWLCREFLGCAQKEGLASAWAIHTGEDEPKMAKRRARNGGWLLLGLALAVRE